MSHQKGLDVRGDPSVCMIVGCTRKAIYRKGQSKRGYCRPHRALAVQQLSEASAIGRLDAWAWIPPQDEGDW